MNGIIFLLSFLNKRISQDKERSLESRNVFYVEAKWQILHLAAYIGLLGGPALLGGIHTLSMCVCLGDGMGLG